MISLFVMDPSSRVVEGRVSNNVPLVPCLLLSAHPSFPIAITCLRKTTNNGFLPDITALWRGEYLSYERVIDEHQEKFARPFSIDTADRSRLCTAYEGQVCVTKNCSLPGFCNARNLSSRGTVVAVGFHSDVNQPETSYVSAPDAGPDWGRIRKGFAFKNNRREWPSSKSLPVAALEKRARLLERGRAL